MSFNYNAQMEMFVPSNELEKYSNIRFVQMCLNYPWEFFSDIAQEYEYERWLELRQQPKVIEGQLSMEFEESLIEEKVDTPFTPKRTSNAGRQPSPFLPLFKAFTMSRLMRTDGNPMDVFMLCKTNPTFSQACGFQSSPSYRTFARFDYIMTHAGLWEKARQIRVQDNLDLGIFPVEDIIAIDTTHVEAEASAPKKNEDGTYTQNPHDDNVGILRKSNTVTYIAHKTSIVCFPDNDNPLLGVSFQGQTSDSKTLIPTLKILFDQYPNLKGKIKYVLADGIYHTEENKAWVKTIGAILVTPINPRNRKPTPVEGVVGITHIDVYGRPVCLSGYPLELYARMHATQDYVWVCPAFNPERKNEGCTCSPSNHAKCCSLAKSGRTVCLSKDMSPQVDWEMPEHAARTKKLYNKRSSIERINGNLKEGYGLRRVEKRNKVNVDAHCDKALLTFHILAHYATSINMPEKIRSWSTFMVA